MVSSRTKLVVPLILLFVLVAVLYVPAFVYTRHLAAVQLSRGSEQSLPVYGSDSSGFVALADTLLQNGHFGVGTADTFRTPGYPALLAFWKLIFGSYIFFPILQIALVFATAALIFLIGRGVFSAAVGAGAAVLFIIDPNTVYHSLVILSEIPHVFLLTLSVCLALLPKPRRLPSEWLAGLVLGLSVYVKPVSLYLPAVFILYFAIREFMRGGPARMKRFGAAAFVFLLAFAATLLPWLARDWRVSGVVGISSVSSFNLFHYTVPEFLAYRERITPDAAREELFSRTAVPLPKLADLTYSSELAREALSYIKADPLHFAGFYTVKTVPFFFSTSLNNFFVTYNDVTGSRTFPTSGSNLTNLLLKGDMRGVFSALRGNPAETGEQLILAAICLFALLSFLNRKRFAETAFLFLLVAYFAAVTGVVAYARLRIPASPFLFILAVSGFSASMGLLWNRKLHRAAKPSPLSSPSTTKPLLLTRSSLRFLPPASRRDSKGK